MILNASEEFKKIKLKLKVCYSNYKLYIQIKGKVSKMIIFGLKWGGWEGFILFIHLLLVNKNTIETK